MVKSFKGCMRKLTLLMTTLPCVLVVILTFLRQVIELVRGPSIVKRLMRVDAVVPIMIF